MSADQLIVAYIEIKGETPPDNLTLRDADFYTAVKPSLIRVAGIKRHLQDAGFTIVDPASGNYTCWDNRILVQGSKQRFEEVFGLEVAENHERRHDNAPTHFRRGNLDIGEDNFLAENVTNVIFPTISEIEPVTQRRKVRHALMGAF